MSSVQVRTLLRFHCTFQNQISLKQNQQFVPIIHSKTALLEGLEVDQYMLGILVYIQK